MMYSDEQYYILNEKTGPLKAQAVKIPFTDNRFSLLIIFTSGGWAVLEDNLTDKEIKRIIKFARIGKRVKCLNFISLLSIYG